ncbi:MAG TPA: adenylosuccinate lyase [Chloroflexi bacterium]|nr:adenylosuccinate lyase [Chloroflexota bacterium]
MSHSRHSDGPSFDHDAYLSPFTWRYGSAEMRTIWSETHRRQLFRRVWVALAAAQHEAGLVSAEQLADLRAHQNDVNLARAAEIEAEIGHDLMAEIHAFAERCPVGGGVIHLGATSADVLDNADVLRIRESLDLLIERVGALLADLAERIETHADHVCIGFTHIQPAEPTTVGYRLAVYGQDVLEDYQELRRLRQRLMGKGIKGAVGTSASYAQLLAGTGVTPAELEARVMEELGLRAFPVATQVYPRQQDYRLLTALAGLAASLYRFAFDLRLLQSPPIGEWSEPFSARQVGSSAMPFKRNPVHAENVDSLARYVAALPRVAWDNAAHSLLERTLDDSANRRLILPDGFLASDELVRRAHRILRGLQFHDEAIARNLETYGPFAATERLLMELVRAGADRQAMHERIREHAMTAWGAVQRGAPPALPDRLSADEVLLHYLPADRVRSLLDAGGHVGDAPERARRLATAIRTALEGGRE